MRIAAACVMMGGFIIKWLSKRGECCFLVYTCTQRNHSNKYNRFVSVHWHNTATSLLYSCSFSSRTAPRLRHHATIMQVVHKGVIRRVPVRMKCLSPPQLVNQVMLVAWTHTLCYCFGSFETVTCYSSVSEKLNTTHHVHVGLLCSHQLQVTYVNV